MLFSGPYDYDGVGCAAARRARRVLFDTDESYIPNSVLCYLSLRSPRPESLPNIFSCKLRFLMTMYSAPKCDRVLSRPFESSLCLYDMKRFRRPTLNSFSCAFSPSVRLSAEMKLSQSSCSGSGSSKLARIPKRHHSRSGTSANSHPSDRRIPTAVGHRLNGVCSV